MNNKYYAVIMAGGVGTRFWPVSTRKFPKQFHDMLGTGESLIQKTFHRLTSLINPDQILIATNEKYEDLVLNQLGEITSSQVLIEPAMRNTAPCILYSALKIYNQNPDGIMLVAPSDHWIENEAAFLNNIQTAFDFCETENALLTLGIQPTSPNTGYGYIKYQEGHHSLFKVEKFTEKPDLETAKSFIKSGNYLWNSGIFIWSAKAIIEAFKQYLPEMHQLLSGGSDYWNTPDEKGFIENNYGKSQNISIDFGLIEKAQNVFVLPVNFDWNDLGTWGSLHNKLKQDSLENAVIGGKVIFKDSSKNMVSTSKGKRVVIQGLNNYIVVEKEDVLLIVPKKDEQDIKKLTEEVKKSFGDEYV